MLRRDQKIKERFKNDLIAGVNMSKIFNHPQLSSLHNENVLLKKEEIDIEKHK